MAVLVSSLVKIDWKQAAWNGKEKKVFFGMELVRGRGAVPAHNQLQEKGRGSPPPKQRQAAQE